MMLMQSSPLLSTSAHAYAAPESWTCVVGAWLRQRVGSEVGDVPWLTRDSGLAALQLSTTATGVEGLHDVEVSQAPETHPACRDFLYISFHI